MRRCSVLFLLALVVSSSPEWTCAEDCNGNGIDDSLDLQPRDGFQPAVSLSAAEHPSRVLAVDLDGDEGLDLVASTRHGLSVFPNAGGGTFGARRDIDLVEKGMTVSVAAADFDGDGLPDLAAVVYNYRQLAIVLNQGEFRFEVRMMDSGRTPSDVAASDLDGDGDVDLAVTNFGGNSFSVFLNDGAATFHHAFAYTVAAGIQDCRPLSLAIGDFDLDEDPDIAVSANVVSETMTNIVAVFTNLGGAVFEDPIAFEVGGEIPKHVAAADLDGDGYPELVTAVSGQVFVFPNFAGAFGAPNPFHAGPPYDVYFVSPVDLDADGDIDVLAAVCASLPHLAILRNDGGGGLGDPEALPVGECPGSALAADLDRNGSLDLISANMNSNDVSLVYGGPLPPESTDENGNGVPDECEARPTFHRGDPEGNGAVDISDAVFVLFYSFLAGPTPACLESADVNNDGLIDVSDAVGILNYLFFGGAPPAEPGPGPAPCGPDPDPMGSPADLGCAFYGCSP